MIRRNVQRLPRVGVLAIILGSLVVMALWIADRAGAAPALKRLLTGPPPTMVNYQGVVNVGGSPFSGTGHFKFAIVDSASGNGTTNYWANDGAASGEPGQVVPLTVENGLFNVLLGDTSLSGMIQPLDETAFSETNTYLRVWFGQSVGGPFEALEPNQRIASVAYALRAKFAENPGPPGPPGPSGVVSIAFNSGSGNDPTTEVEFLAPTAIVDVESGQQVFVVSTKGLGSFNPGGAADLAIAICYRAAGSSDVLSVVGDGIVGLAVGQNQRVPMTLSAAFSPGAGTFEVGMCGISGDAANWNSNEWGYTSAFVANPSTVSTLSTGTSRLQGESDE